MSTQRILAATDLSEPTDEALRQASEQARLRRAELYVCHVAPRLVGSHMLFPQEIEQEVLAQPQVGARLADAVRERTSAVTGRSPDQFQVIIIEGTTYAEILRQADTLAVGLLVVGSHGRAGLGSIFLGDVAEKVVAHAHTSVLVARPHARSGRLLVATDFSDTAFAALQWAAEQSRLTSARVTLMCSIRKRLQPILGMTTFGSDYRFVEQEDVELRDKAARELAALLDRAGVAGDTVVTDADAAVEIVHLAAKIDAEAVVIGAIGRTSLRGLRLGRIAERVTRHAPCSVVVVRKGGHP
jgi:nucleotide-binding universal stress UspA family protein